MSAFQDSLVVSEVHDWVDLLQPFHQSKSEKGINAVFDLEGDAEPEQYPDISLAGRVEHWRGGP